MTTAPAQEQPKLSPQDFRVLMETFQQFEQDTRRILGLFRRILWRLKHTPIRDDKSD